MSSKKFFYMMVGVSVLLFGLLVAAAVGGNMLLQNQSKKLTDLKVENESMELQQNALIQAKKDVEKYKNLEEITRRVVPQDKDQARTVREIVTLADQSGVPIKSVTFPASTLGAAAPTTTSPPAGEGGDAAATAKPKAPPASQLKAVEGIPGVYTLEIQVSSSGQVSYTSFLRFLEALETNRRTAHVFNIALNPDRSGRFLDFNLTLNAYVKPQ